MKTIRAIAAAAATLAAMPLAGAGVPHEVLAFYYGWYGNPQTSGRWVHWKDVDAAQHRISGSTHYPEAGAYDSHEVKTVERQCRQARDAGITGFIATWWRKGDFHDAGMPLLLDTAAKNGLKVTVYYETATSTEDATANLLYILGQYARHAAWLKVDGKPVVFVYGRAVGQLKLDGWQKVIADVNREHPGGAVFIGDQISEKAAQVFDGIHTYNITGKTKGMSEAEIRKWAGDTFPQQVAAAGKKISCVTIIPGYDDTHLPDRKPPRPVTDRHEGRTYAALWEQAIAARPDWILITSWNEWHEGSEIEPSLENGDRELRTTTKYARRFVK